MLRVWGAFLLDAGVFRRALGLVLEGWLEVGFICKTYVMARLLACLSVAHGTIWHHVQTSVHESLERGDEASL